jgi:hypothetical protein
LCEAKIVKYLDFVGKGLGCDVVKGTCATAFEPMTAKEQAKRNRALAKQAERFARQLAQPAGAAPGLFELPIFRYARTSMWHELDEINRDWQYYEQQGWFESDYCETELGVGKRALGRALDAVFARVAQGTAVRRKKHPNRHVEEALRYAEGKGWRVEPSGRSSHAWGKLFCPHDDPECRCGQHCISSIASMPRVPENHAAQIVRRVDGCVGEPRGGDDE